MRQISFNTAVDLFIVPNKYIVFAKNDGSVIYVKKTTEEGARREGSKFVFSSKSNFKLVATSSSTMACTATTKKIALKIDANEIADFSYYLIDNTAIDVRDIASRLTGRRVVNNDGYFVTSNPGQTHSRPEYPTAPRQEQPRQTPRPTEPTVTPVTTSTEIDGRSINISVNVNNSPVISNSQDNSSRVHAPVDVFAPTVTPSTSLVDFFNL